MTALQYNSLKVFFKFKLDASACAWYGQLYGDGDNSKCYMHSSRLCPEALTATENPNTKPRTQITPLPTLHTHPPFLFMDHICNQHEQYSISVSVSMPPLVN